MKKPLSVKEIDTIAISQADDHSKWDEPVCVQPKKHSLKAKVGSRSSNGSSVKNSGMKQTGRLNRV